MPDIPVVVVARFKKDLILLLNKELFLRSLNYTCFASV